MHPNKNCPAKDAKFHKYGKTGHSQRACKRKAVGEVTGEIFPNDFFLGEIVVENIEVEPWKLNLEASRIRKVFTMNCPVNKILRPDSTPAKFFARTCLCGVQMVAHE